MPTAFADVAAPIRKLYVLYLESSNPALFSVAEKRVLNWALVKGASPSEINNGPGTLPLVARYGSKALMGHTTDSVRPRPNNQAITTPRVCHLLACQFLPCMHNVH